jgi:RNA polymerase-binding transcription factor DksA
MTEIVEVPIGQILRSPFQPRSELAELETVTQPDDVLLPLLVRRINGSYELVDGEGRLERMKKLGAPTVRCEIREMDDRAVAAAVLLVNEERRSFSDEDRARWLASYMKKFGATQTEAARAGHIDEGKASRLKDIAIIRGWLGPERVDTVKLTDKPNSITQHKLGIIASLPKEKRAPVIKVVEESKVSTQDTKVVVAKVRGGNDPAEAVIQVQNWKESHRQEVHQDRRRVHGKKAAPKVHYGLCEECGDRISFAHIGPHRHAFFEEGTSF